MALPITPRAAISAYVKRRLAVECEPRGAAAKIGRAIGTSGAHLSNIKKMNRGIGDDLARKMASYWKMTYAELERVAVDDARRLPIEEEQKPAVDVEAAVTLEEALIASRSMVDAAARWTAYLVGRLPDAERVLATAAILRGDGPPR